MATGTFVSWDPTTPQGSESLRTGPSRIKIIPENILSLFGFPSNVPGTFQSPFSDGTRPGILNPDTAPELLLLNDPTDPRSAVPKSYADSKVTTAFTVTDGGTGTNYTGTASPEVTNTPIDGQLFLVRNVGGTNTGDVSLDLGAGPTSVFNDLGQQIPPGDFAAGVLYLLAFEGGTFGVVGFMGGHLTQPLFLDATPTDPANLLQAATKQYADTNLHAPVTSTMATATVTMATPTPAVVIQPPDITIPADASYALHVAYGFYAGAAAVASVNDGTNYWAVSRSGDQVLSAAGWSPVIYPPSTVVTLKLLGSAPGVFAYKSAQTLGIGPISMLPDAFLTYTLVRGV